MTHDALLRLARPGDLGAVDDLLAQSYPRLLKRDYPPSIMVTIVPLLIRARPELLASGRYFVVEAAEGRLLGAGGYSTRQRPTPGRASIRHVATHPDAVRQGVGRRLMQAIFAAAEAEGVRIYDCDATRTAVPFYQAMGFIPFGTVQIPILPGLAFPAVAMRRVV